MQIIIPKKWKDKKVDPFIQKYLKIKEYIHNFDKDDKSILLESKKYYQKIRDNYDQNSSRVKAKYQLYLDRDRQRFDIDNHYREEILKYLLEYIKLFKYYIDNYFELRYEYEKGSDRIYNRKSKFRKEGLDPNIGRSRRPTRVKNISLVDIILTDDQKEQIQIQKLTKKYIMENKNKKKALHFKSKNL